MSSSNAGRVADNTSNTTTPRKRRRRTAATGAAEDCFTCRKRQTRCDRRRPYCTCRAVFDRYSLTMFSQAPSVSRLARTAPATGPRSLGGWALRAGESCAGCHCPLPIQIRQKPPPAQTRSNRRRHLPRPPVTPRHPRVGTAHRASKPKRSIMRAASADRLTCLQRTLQPRAYRQPGPFQYQPAIPARDGTFLGSTSISKDIRRRLESRIACTFGLDPSRGSARAELSHMKTRYSLRLRPAP